MAETAQPKEPAAPASAAEEAPPPKEEPAKPVEEVPPPVEGDDKILTHTLIVKIVKAWGLKDDGARTDSFVRYTLLDENGETLGMGCTETITDGGSEPAWNEYVKFPDIKYPCLCSLRMELIDDNQTKLEPGETYDSKTVFQLGRLQAVTGFQQFREVIPAGATSFFSSKAELSFEMCTLGKWGNAATKEGNKVVVKVISASNLKDMDGGLLWSDKNDPYCVVEMVHSQTGEVIKKVKTKVLQEAGAEALWNEEFTFDEAWDPCACKLQFSVWDKDVLTKDDALGKTEFKLGSMTRSETKTPLEFELPLELKDSNATMKFSVCGTGLWGTALEGVNPGEWAEPKPPKMGHMFSVKIVGASGLSAITDKEQADGKPGKADPVCRVTLRDEWGTVFKTFTTKVKNNAGADVMWNESFSFKGFQNPGACTLCLNVVDADNGCKSFERLGETSFALGRAVKKAGPQEFEEDIAGVIFKSKVKFQIDNKGFFGSGSEAEKNKLYVKVKKGKDLDVGDGGILARMSFNSSPYVYVELVDSWGKVLEKKETAKKQADDGDVTWDEELVFEKMETPAACKLILSVYEGMSKVGSCQFKLGTLESSSKYLDFDGTTLGGSGKLDFAIHNGGTWGHEQGCTPAPVEKGESQPGCGCSVM